MTEVGRIAEMSDRARRQALLRHLAGTLSVVRPQDAPEVCELLAGWLEENGAGSPRLDVFGDVREDARFWADQAHPAELEAYVAAGLRRIERTQFAQGARKRLLVALWEAMGERDRRRFIRRVDPEGRFQKVRA